MTGTRREAARAVILCLLGGAAGCVVPRPTVAQLLDMGHSTPTQTYDTWLTALQGELLVEEYECLSKGWRKRNGDVSLFGYSEVRDATLARYPLLRWALHRAERPREVSRTADAVVLEARIPGYLWVPAHWLRVRLVRQAFTAVTVEGEPSAASFGRQDINLHEEGALRIIRRGAKTTLEARIEVPASPDDGTVWPEDLLLLEVGYRWRVDDFGVFDDPLAQ